MTQREKASPPPRIRVRFKELSFYKAGYGGDVAIEEHVDVAFGKERDWPQYLSLSEHEEAISRATAEAKISILRNLLDNDMIVTWAQESGRERCFDLEKALAARSVEPPGEAKKEGER